MISFYNMDCMEGMKKCPDGYYDLAIVDPPYGNANKTKTERCKRFGGRFDKYKTDATIQTSRSMIWDVAPGEDYFNELFRVSKNQIIWGGNYFRLPPTRCFVVWEKLTISEEFTMAMCEYAWTSFDDNAKIYKHIPQDAARFHPTQKPVNLYKWLLNRYAKPGYKILDTHVGSGSSLIACQQLGYDAVGYELNAEYYQKATQRIEKETAQLTLFNAWGE